MKIVHVSNALSRTAGGIFEIELGLAKALDVAGVKTAAIGLECVEWENDKLRWDPVPARTFPIIGPRFFGFSSGLKDALTRENADMVHLHTMWMYPSVAVSRWSEVSRKPYLVTPNGMLEPWALSNSGWKKKIAGFCYEDQMLRNAACLQANTEKEMRDIRAYGLRNPICIIPNGVDLPEEEPEIKWRKMEGGRKTLLFLGRIHPKKGLSNALRAFADVRSPKSVVRVQEDWQFVIAGWDQLGHEADLKRLCKELGLAFAEVPATAFLAEDLTSDLCRLASVIFVGPAFGDEKDHLLRQASVFILPSFSEGLPMSVLEAWSYRLPVLMTDNCNIPEGFSVNAAIYIGTDTASIAEGMRQVFFLPGNDNVGSTASLSSMGCNGRALVESQFTWPQVAAQMTEVYEWVLGGGPRPSMVVD